MASTGKTTNYELSQFIGTDKPSWLGDYNGDMLKIDTALGSINATATTAQSGVASAQSAASAAQATADAAQQQATANAQNITDLKAALTNSVVTMTNSPNVTAGNVVLSYSDYIKVFKINAMFNVTSHTDYNLERRVPIASIAENIMKLPTSTLADNNSKFYVGPASVRGAAKSLPTEDKIFTYSIGVYYDGANTVVYLAIPVSDFSTHTFNYTWGDLVVLPSGSFVNFPRFFNI